MGYSALEYTSGREQEGDGKVCLRLWMKGNEMSKTKEAPVFYLNTKRNVEKASDTLFDVLQKLESADRARVSAVIDLLDELVMEGRW